MNITTTGIAVAVALAVIAAFFIFPSLSPFATQPGEASSLSVGGQGADQNSSATGAGGLAAKFALAYPMGGSASIRRDIGRDGSPHRDACMTIQAIDNFLPQAEQAALWEFLRSPGWSFGAYSSDAGHRYFFAMVTEMLLRPFARRRRNTSRPPRVFLRARKPCVRLRLLLCGWYVRFTASLRQ